MPDFRSVYRYAEEHTALYIGLIFVVLIGLLLAQTLVSGMAVLALVIGIGFFLLTLTRPLWALGILAAYLPFESLVLKFVPDEIYVFAKYFPEGLIYLLVALVVWRRLSGKLKAIRTPINLPFAFFVVVAIASIVINFVHPTIAVLGLRQILRFIFVFFIAVALNPSRPYVQKLTRVLFLIVAFEAGLGLVQAAVGAPLDEVLLPSETRVFGDLTLTSGVVQFWESGSRVFATLGRYDRLGTFLAFFLLLVISFLYEPSFRRRRRPFLWGLLLVGLPALILTYSRSSWFGFLLGFLFIGWVGRKDRRVLMGSLLGIGLLGTYLLYSGVVVRYLVDMPSQTLAERFFEAFSFARWQGEYYGLGRLFWIVQTVLVVVPFSPFFGVGPGQYGGGAAAALGNARVYEQLGLPFGVYGTDGYIDNSWFSLWGETGTLGLAFYLWAYVALFFFAWRLFKRCRQDPYVRSLSLGYAAAMLAVSINAFLATFLEVRTLAFYLWLYGGFIVALANQSPFLTSAKKVEEEKIFLLPKSGQERIL
ncbi:MAG TPA: O-antigen ligase family protein [Patescibacteria group bacterium]|nr:O-antigen ligase family protein [Patescibacteria group bacterium]